MTLFHWRNDNKKQALYWISKVQYRKTNSWWGTVVHSSVNFCPVVNTAIWQIYTNMNKYSKMETCRWTYLSSYPTSPNPSSRNCPPFHRRRSPRRDPSTHQQRPLWRWSRTAHTPCCIPPQCCWSRARRLTRFVLAISGLSWSGRPVSPVGRVWGNLQSHRHNLK